MASETSSHAWCRDQRFYASSYGRVNTCAAQKFGAFAKRPPSRADIRDAARREPVWIGRDSRWGACAGVDLPEPWLGMAPEFQVLMKSEGAPDCNGIRTH